MRRAAARGMSRRRIGLFPVLLALLVLGGIAAIAFTVRDAAGPSEPPEGVLSFERPLEKSHVEGPVSYEVVPPVGGPHWGIVMNCGFYSEPVATEAAVHSLEHGAVWIAYDPGLPEGEIRTLRGLAGRSHVLVSPWADPAELPSPVVASAWGAQLHLGSTEDRRLGEFLTFYRLHPAAPEPGAPCHGGIGEPE